MSIETTATAWFNAKGADLAAAIKAHLDYLDERLSAERRKDEIHSVLYQNRHAYSGAFAQSFNLMQARGGSPLRLNVTRSMVETLTARIAQDFPLVEAAADGAEWSYKLKARRMSRFITTKQEETGFRRIAPLAFRDGLIKGGVCKVTSEHGELVHERIPKSEIFIDELEARYGHPRNLHQRKQYSREVLISMFPDKQSEIQQAPEAEPREYDDFRLGQFNRTNLVDVIESYHLPSAPGAGDGLHVISLYNGSPVILHQEEWARKRLPFAFFHWSPPETGFWGTSLVEELAQIQWSIDRTVNVLEEGFRLGAPLRVFLQRNSRIVKTQLISRVGTIVECSGAPPEIKAPSNPVSQQQISWLMQLFELAYQIAGVSQMAASAKKPGSLESGEALRVYHDFETERFKHVENAYQNFALDCAELAIDEAKSIYGTREESKSGKPGKRLYPDYHAKWVHRSLVEKINWKDVDLDRDSFKLKLKPANLLKESIAGKLESAQFLAQSGLIPGHYLLSLLGEHPDVARVVRLETARLNYAEWFVEQLMDPDKAMPQASSIADLELLEAHTKAAALDSQTDGAPPRVLKRFHNAITTIAAKKKSAKQAAAAAQAPAGPQAVPSPGGPLPPGEAPTAMEGQALPNAPLAAA